MISFELAVGNRILKGDRFAMKCSTLVLHGAGESSRERFKRLRRHLHQQGVLSVSFDFLGHGETRGSIFDSSLQDRTNQAAAIIRYACNEPLTLIASSMSGYTGIKLTELFLVRNLILLVPAVYTPTAYEINFGPAFSEVIQKRKSWRNSDAFDILSRFKGNLLIIAAETDNIIPREVVELIYSSAKKVKNKAIHFISNSSHSLLFPTDCDFQYALDLMLEVCR